MRRLSFTMLALAVGMAGCAPQDAPDEQVAPAEPITLGPVDGHDLPGVDLERVQTGDVAPDFTLASLGGPPVTLSDYRGEKNVILVFYRGYW